MAGRNLNIMSSFEHFIADKINKLHEKTARFVYGNYNTTLKTLLGKQHAFTIHHKNMDCLRVEISIILRSKHSKHFFLRVEISIILRSKHSKHFFLRVEISIILRSKHCKHFFLGQFDVDLTMVVSA